MKFSQTNINLHIETKKEKEFVEALDNLCFKYSGINYHFEVMK